MQADAEQQYVEYLTARLPRLHRIAYLLCGDRHRAEDIVHGYVNQILFREFLGLKRLGWSRVLLTERPPDRADPADTTVEDRDAVMAALARLGNRQRAVIVLRYFCDLSVEQTAELLGCAEGTVKSQAARGLQTLRELLGTTYPSTTRRGTR